MNAFSKLFCRVFCCLCVLWGALAAQAADKPPVLVGLDGEFGREGATSAQSIELGLRAAILQINAAGGVLGGRAVELVSRDNREILARSVANTAEFSAMPDLVAVFAGRSSPLILAQIQAVHAAKLPYLVPWAAADSIIDNGMQPNYVFRLSLQDSLAMPRLLQSAQRRGFDKVGLLLLNTSFGNSNLAAAEKYMRNVKNQKIVGVDWFNLRDTSLIRQYKKLTDAGAKAVLLSANYEDAAVLVREVAALPPGERVPVISHWGVTSGTFVKQAGVALQDVDFSVIQTFSFFSADKQQLARFMKSAAQISGVQRVEDIEAPLGAAHAYDLMHILARAIQLAGSTERSAIRDALEKVPEHRGLLKLYKPPFTPARHEALGPGELLMARYSREGVLVPAQK